MFYFLEYGSKLSDDIKAMTSGSQQRFLLTLLSMERSSNLDVNQDLATNDAEELLKVCHLIDEITFLTLSTNN